MWTLPRSGTGPIVLASTVVAVQSCLTLCAPMDCSITDFPVFHRRLEFVQTHIHWANDAIQPAHPLSHPSFPALSLSQHQGLFQWVDFSQQISRMSSSCNLWCWRRLLRVSLDCKEIQPISPKGNQPWILIGRTDAETEAPIHWPPDMKSWLTGKDPDAGKDWRQEEKGVTEDEMVGWHQWLTGHEIEQSPGDSEGQGSLVCCSPWGCKKLDMTERLNWTELRTQWETELWLQRLQTSWWTQLKHWA